MPRGTVKWFNNAKGFGFILPDGGGDDLFAHYSSIEMDGYKTLKAGQPVIFEIENGDKGPHASHIQLEAAQDSSSNDSHEDTQSASENSYSESRELEGAH